MLIMTNVWDLWQEFEKNAEEEPAKETTSRWALKNLALSSEPMLYLTTVDRCLGSLAGG